MEKINTDYKRQIWKIEAKLFNMRKPWLSSFREWNNGLLKNSTTNKMMALTLKSTDKINSYHSKGKDGGTGGIVL